MSRWVTEPDWREHKALIVDLYIHKRMTLPKVAEYMELNHQFHATPRMYKVRFSQWGIYKNNRRKNPCPSDPVSDTASRPPASPPSPSESSQTRTVRSWTPTTLNHEGPQEGPSRDPRYAPSPSPLPSVPNRQVDSIIASMSGLLRTLTPRYRPPSPPRSPDDSNSSLYPAPENHLEIYQALQHNLEHEQKLRGRLINGREVWKREQDKSAANTIFKEAFSHIRPMLERFHPAVPIGVVSTFSQLEDVSTARALAESLVEHSSAVLPNRHDFTAIVRCLRHMLETETFDSFRILVQEICLRMSQEIEVIFGRKSLAGMYLIVLIRAGTASSAIEDQAREDPTRKMLHQGVNDVQQYPDRPKLVLEFSYYIIGYLVRRSPGRLDVLNMAFEMVERAKGYKDQAASSNNRRDIADANFYLCRSYVFLAEYHYAHHHASLTDCHYNLHEIETARSTLYLAIQYQTSFAKKVDAFARRHLLLLQKWCTEEPPDEALSETAIQQLSEGT